MGTQTSGSAALYLAGPEVTLPRLPATTPYELFVTREDLAIEDSLQLMLFTRRLAYLAIPPVSLLAVDMVNMMTPEELIDRVRHDRYPKRIECMEDIHLPRILELIERRKRFYDRRPLLAAKRRNLFPFHGYSIVLQHSIDPPEKEWHAADLAGRENVLKKRDRVFLVQSE